MRHLSKAYVKAAANTAWQQIKATAAVGVIGSWGISELFAQEISVHTEDGELSMPVLVMRVQGFCHNGYVFVALNEGKDLYCIYTARSEDAGLREYQSEVSCDELADCLDKCIERGNMTEAQYRQRIADTYFVM